MRSTLGHSSSISQRSHLRAFIPSVGFPRILRAATKLQHHGAARGVPHASIRVEQQAMRGSKVQRVPAVSSATDSPTPAEIAETSPATAWNVLVATDEVQATDACITWVLNSTPKRGTLKIHLLHCISSPKASAFGIPLGINLFSAQQEAGGPEQEDAAEQQQRWEMQQAFGSRLDEAKVPYELHVVRQGSSSGKDAIGAAICKQAEHLDCALVVMASKARGGLPELFQGSVAKYVTHHCERPVVVMHAAPVPAPAVDAAAGAGAPAGGAASCNILAAIDDSELSNMSCRWTINNLYCPGDTIHLMHVVPCLPLTTDVPPFEGGLLFGPALPFDLGEKEAEAWKQAQADRFKAIMDEAGAAYTFDVTSECTQDPVTAISQDLCCTASQLQAKALVCVARKNTALEELLFNSVTNYVTHHCDQPVVVLHA